MKKILFFAVMFCVALSSAMLVSCGGDDDIDEPKGDNMFKCSIKFTDDLLDLYKDVSVVFKFQDGTEFSGNVTANTVTVEHKMDKTQDVVVIIDGTLIEDKVDEAKAYNVRATIAGVYNDMTSATIAGFASVQGKAIKDKAHKLSDMMLTNTLKFTELEKNK